MIYLIQDCYKNDKGEYIDILKIGYSDKPFMKSRNNQYQTHNFGYRFLGEREGDTKFESYLHEKYKLLRLSEDTEWFIYDDSIVNEFFTVDESEKDIILTKCQYISNIQEYLLRTITKPEDLYNKYKELIVEELESEYGNIVKEEKDVIHERIKDTFIFGYNTTINYIKENWTLSNECFSNIPDLISKTWLDENPWKNYAEFYYKTNMIEISQEEFFKVLDKKIKDTNKYLSAFEKLDPEEKHLIAENYLFVAKAKRYKDNYLSVDEHAGSDLKPVFNKLVMISEKRSFEIQKMEYADRFSVFNALNQVSNPEDLNEYIKTIYSFNATYERYRYLCSLQEQTILAILPHLPTSYQNYYTVLGPDRMRACGYDVTRMKREYEGIIGNQGICIRDYIIPAFEIGETYSKAEVKAKLKSIYDSVGYTKTPRAVDLGDYFIIKNRMITNKDTGKRDNCYYIEKVKEGVD